MRILYCAWVDPATTDYPLFLADAFTRMGHEVYLLPPDLTYYNHNFAELCGALGVDEQQALGKVMSRQLARLCRSLRPHVVLYSGAFLDLGVFFNLRRELGFAAALIMSYNNLLVGDGARFISAYDLIFLKDSYMIPILQGDRDGRNPNVFWMPPCADPHEHRPVALSEEDQSRYGRDVSFVGGISPNRIEACKKVADTGCALRIYGDSRWSSVPELAAFYSEERVYGLRKTKIYNASKVILNIMDTEKNWNLVAERVTEGLACGGFPLMDWRKDLEACGLVEGVSVAVFRSLDELGEKTRFYLANPEICKTISQNGQRIVLQSLTYDHCADRLMRNIESVMREKGMCSDP